MSEENAPKLRLKPKLAADPVIAPQPPAAPQPAPPAAPPTPPVSEEPKAVRLKPKLAAEPSPGFVQNAPPPSAPAADPAPPVTRSIPPASTEDDKPAAKFSLRPKASAESPAAQFPPPPLLAEDAGSADVPIPAPAFIDPEQETPAGGAIPARNVTARPFPPPPANFPAPPAAAGKPVPPWAQIGSSPSGRSKKKNFLVYGGVTLVALGVLVGAFLAYTKFIAKTPEPVIAHPVAQPENDPSAQALAEKTRQAAAQAASAAAAAEAQAVAAKAVQAPVIPEPEVPVEEPPPPPSAAFQAWVENLRVGGVRGGANTRVFIGGTAYAIGDNVNQQLGIIFEGYNSETRRLIFKDKSGAIVERRN